MLQFSPSGNMPPKASRKSNALWSKPKPRKTRNTLLLARPESSSESHSYPPLRTGDSSTIRTHTGARAHERTREQVCVSARARSLVYRRAKAPTGEKRVCTRKHTDGRARRSERAREGTEERGTSRRETALGHAADGQAKKARATSSPSPRTRRKKSTTVRPLPPPGDALSRRLSCLLRAPLLLPLSTLGRGATYILPLAHWLARPPGYPG